MAEELERQGCLCAEAPEEQHAQAIADKEMHQDATPGRSQQMEDGCPMIDGASHEAEEEKQLSKTQLKKLLRMQHMEELKRTKKQEKKDLRHQETLRKREESAERMAAISTEERAEVYRLKYADREARRIERVEHRARLDQGIANGQNIVIDLEWECLMLPQEIKSLGQQVMYCYGANTRATVPCHLTLAGCRGAILERLENISGFDRWRLDRDVRPYVEIFADRKHDLVYLTADSPNVIDSLDNSKIYVIGGVVDRNRFKNCTLDKANEQGIMSAKLPITDHMKLSSSQVLTVNQVMDILLGYLQHENWPKALDHAIPLRKRVVDPPAKSP